MLLPLDTSMQVRMHHATYSSATLLVVNFRPLQVVYRFLIPRLHQTIENWSIFLIILHGQTVKH